MKKHAALLLAATVALLPTLPATSAGEIRTLSWSPVTTYSDGTLIESATAVTYTAYWTTDAGLSAATLRQLAAAVTQTSAPFDPDAQGMPRGQTVYFTLKSVLSTGDESALAAPYSWDVPLVLAGLSIAGPFAVNENESGTYWATASWTDGSTSSVTPSWSENSSYASISAAGVLAASAVTGNQTVTVSASYASGGTTRTATMAMTIVDVPPTALSAPENLDITGPVTISGTKQWKLGWNAVATYENGTPIEPGATVRYSAYWTTDAALSEASLRPMAASISGTSVTFDPAVEGMGGNDRVYFTTRAVLDSGKQSGLSAAVSWKVSNAGPQAPRNGRIRKK